MYNPCFTCWNRFGHDYSSDCDNQCEYAQAVKELKELKEKQLYIREIKQYIDPPMMQGIFYQQKPIDGYDWVSEELEEKLRKEIKVEDSWSKLIFKERFIKVT